MPASPAPIPTTRSRAPSVCIVTAGVPRKPGMSRDDLLGINLKVMEQVGAGIKKYAPECLRHLHHQSARRDGVGAAEISPACRSNMVVGMAGVLDSARFRYFLADEFNVSVEDVTAFVLGGHGDTMVPLVRYSTVAGIPLPDLDEDGLDHAGAARRDREAHRAMAAPRSSICSRPARPSTRRPRPRSRWRKAICKDKKRVLPCAAWLKGEYGVKDMYVGVPVVIGAKGVERVVEIDLTGAEREMFDKSAAAVQHAGRCLQEDRAGTWKVSELRSARCACGVEGRSE